MSLLNTLYNFIASPLDQFGGDDMVVFDVDIFTFNFLDKIDLLDLLDLLNIDIVSTVLPNFISAYFYDDEDCGDSEWEDNEVNVSGIQSSILVSNLFGMLPGADLTTAEAVLTFFFSISTMTTLIVVGFSLHNIRYFAILFPTGTPLIMAPFIILIEFISYTARVISLGMRLFANMFAGHSLVKIIMSFTWLFLTSTFPLLSIPVFILLLIIFLMELGIAYLQSYVFGALAAMYFEEVITLGH